MKRMEIVCVIIFLVFISACGGSPQTISGTAAASFTDELDLAIRDASDYLNDNLPGRSTIVILNIESDSTSLSDYIIEELIANAVNDRVFTVVDRQQLDAIRAEQNFQFSGEVDDNLALEIGRFFGAQTIVSGSLRPLGVRYRLTIRALGVQTAQVQCQYNRNITEVDTITELLKTSTNTSRTTSTPQATPAAAAAPAPTPTPAQTPTPAPSATAAVQPGTYLFWPRIQAYENGIPINAYIYQIVVRGRNLLIYLGNTERGPATGGASGNVSSGILTNLDRPSQSWARVGESRSPDYSVGATIVSFENITGNRFSLGNRNAIFEEIKLSDAEYTP